MQSELDCTLPIATLFQAPSVRQFAALLAQAGNGNAVTPWSSLVPIQPGGTQSPFFFHGGSADALTWARFANLLGPDQPFYAFQRPDLDGRETMSLTVEALAADCVKELRNAQPEGPYILGGHCFGGAVAFEMAQQLQAQGQVVTALVLIDAYRPEVLPETRLIQLKTQLNIGLFWLRKNYYYYGNKKNLKRLPGRLWQRIRPSKTVPSAPVEGAPAAALEAAADSVDSLTVSSTDSVDSMRYEVRYERAIAANEVAVAQYQAVPYRGNLQLFRAQVQMLEWYFGPTLGWRSVVRGQLSTTMIPGFFGNLFNQKSAPILAAQVKAYLQTLK